MLNASQTPERRTVTRGGELVRSTHANGDIVGYRVSYNRTRLEVVLRYRALNFSAQHLYAEAYLAWGGSWAELAVEAGEGNRAGTAGVSSDGDADDSCPVTHRISYRHNRVVMRAPSRCFHAPRMLSVRLATVTFEGRDVRNARLDAAPGRDIRQERLLRVRRG